MIGRDPVLGPLHTLIDVVANQIVGFLRWSPLDEDRSVCFPGGDHLTGSRGHTCKQHHLLSHCCRKTCRRVRRGQRRSGQRHTFEFLCLDGSGRFGWLAASVHVGRQNSEPILFALCQIKHGITGRSNGDLSVYTLPRSALLQTLQRRREQTLAVTAILALVFSSDCLGYANQFTMSLIHCTQPENDHKENSSSHANTSWTLKERH